MLSRVAARNPAPAAGKLHLGRSLWLSAPSFEILRIKAFLPPSILKKENCELAGGKGLAQGLPANDHKKNPDLRGHQCRKSWVRPSSVLGVAGNELRNQTPSKQTGPPCPPLSKETRRPTATAPLPPGPYFSQPRFGMERLGCLEPS